MKRSEINAAIETAKAVLKKHGFHLPFFAFWTPEDWRRAGPECDRIKFNDLGWAVTDFGLGDFNNCGVVMFTLRNGNRTAPDKGTPYAEKVLVLKPGQRVPLHFHWEKTEDIINRQGGTLVMRVYRSREDHSIDRESPVRIFCDGMEKNFGPGESFELEPGQSVTLAPGVFHSFWAKPEGGTLVGGEVSSVSDAYRDNHFGEAAQLFIEIQEDEPPIDLLSHEYP